LARAFQAGNLMTTITASLCQHHMKNLCARISWQARIVAGKSIKNKSFVASLFTD